MLHAAFSRGIAKGERFGRRPEAAQPSATEHSPFSTRFVPGSRKAGWSGSYLAGSNHPPRPPSSALLVQYPARTPYSSVSVGRTLHESWAYTSTFHIRKWPVGTALPWA